MNKRKELIQVIFLISLLLLPNIIVPIHSFSGFKNIIYEISVYILISIFLLLPTAVISLKKTILITSPLFFLLHLEIIHHLIVGNHLEIGNFISISIGKLEDAKNILPIISKHIITYIVYLSIAISFILYIRTNNLFSNKLNLRLRFTIVISFLFFICVEEIYLYRKHQIHITEIISYYPPFSTIRTIIKTKLIERKLEGTNTLDYKITQNIRTDKQEIIVLIIGESSSYSHWGINNYKRNTSPETTYNNNFISFDNYLATSNFTDRSVPLMLTSAMPKNYSLSYREKGIASIFKKCGFSTYWISNQGIVTKNGGLYPKDIDYMKTFPTYKYNDDILLPHIKTALQQEEEKKFFVIHLIGSHFSPDARYPNYFKKWSPSNKDNTVHNDDYNLWENDYDNSILFSSYIFNKITQMIEDRNVNSMVIYTSDHGSCYRPENVGAQYSDLGLNKESLHVPLFFKFSGKYLNKSKQKIINLNRNKGMKSNANSLFHTVLELANIKTECMNDSLSLASNLFSESFNRFAISPSYKIVRID